MKLSIIILNYNTQKLLQQTIDSIQARTTHELIVVDNASVDGSVKYLQKQSNITSVFLKKNVGFAAGNNQGIKLAQGQYIFLLNSDTLVQPQAIDKCIKYLDSHPKVGILSPKLSLPDGSIDLSCHRGFPTPSNSLAYFLKLEQIFPNYKPFSEYHQTWKNFSQTHQVDAVSGASMFIRKEVIDQIGLLDERFFMYAEDIDFCCRAKNQGWQVVYFPEAEILHLKGSSGTKHSDSLIKTKTKHHFYQTMKQYFDKHHQSKYPKPIRSLIHTSIDIIARLRQ